MRFLNAITIGMFNPTGPETLMSSEEHTTALSGDAGYVAKKTINDHSNHINDWRTTLYE